ncbi:hypothetical protein V7182_04550 [Neobacillus drentensis]|uniref:hypothetical protein n=1 Tax=Neobacillus drentensis TaxID=220684 RepID=UPI003000DD35
MAKDYEKLVESRNLLHKMANGMNPVDGMPIKAEGFLNDPRIIRSLFFLVDYLDEELSKEPRQKRVKFIITDNQLNQVVLPEGNIGINDFANAINAVIDTRTTRRINGTMINKQLKKLGILGEGKTEEGKTRTVTNDKSEGYGIVTAVRFYNDRQYEQVVFNDTGKEFLLRNLQKIMSYK